MSLLAIVYGVCWVLSTLPGTCMPPFSTNPGESIICLALIYTKGLRSQGIHLVKALLGCKGQFRSYAKVCLNSQGQPVATTPQAVLRLKAPGSDWLFLQTCRRLTGRPALPPSAASWTCHPCLLRWLLAAESCRCWSPMIKIQGMAPEMSLANLSASQPKCLQI